MLRDIHNKKMEYAQWSEIADALDRFSSEATIDVFGDLLNQLAP